MLLDKAARVAGVPRPTLRNDANTGHIRCKRTSGGYRLCDPSDVAAYAAKRRKSEVA